MSIDFPNSPTTGQTFASGGATWRWDSTKWTAYSAAIAGDITSVIAGTGLSGGGLSGDVTLSLATPVSVANGGTGATSLTANAILAGNGTGAVTATAATQVGNNMTVPGSVTAGTSGGVGGVPLALGSPAGNDCIAQFSIISQRQWKIGVTNPSNSYLTFDSSAGANRFQIDTGGVCYNTSGTWTAFSDSRAKQNQTPYRQGLRVIEKLQPIRYDLKTDEWEGEGLIGFQAEQIAEVMPELGGTAQALLGGKMTELKTVAPTGVVFALVNAVKELSERLAALERKVSQ